MTFIEVVFVERWPFWAGGVVIGLLVPLLYYAFNTALGVSTGYGNLARILLPSRRLTWLQERFKEAWGWRVYFIGGIILGSFLSARLTGAPLWTGEMGVLTETVTWSGPVLAIYFFAGGVLLGLGARIAGGCTSGHSIHGMANGHLSSVLVTLFFLVGGIISANVLRLLVLGGGSG